MLTPRRAHSRSLSTPMPRLLGLLHNPRRLHLLKLNFLGQQQIQHHRHKRGDGKARLHDKLNRIQESLETLIVSRVGEKGGKVSGHKRGTVAEGEASSEDEAVAAGKGHAARDDCDTRDGDGGEEEGCHAANDGGGDGGEGCCELGKDAHDDEEDAVFRDWVSQLHLVLSWIFNIG